MSPLLAPDWEVFGRGLSFHARGTPVATASAAQVRRPLNRDAVDRWRCYGDALAPLYQLLTEAALYRQ